MSEIDINCSYYKDVIKKEPIINGIDVSECEYFKINRGFNCYKGYNCTDKECSDCYFKQLKRLQKENEELYEKNVQLKEENEELKARLKTLDDEVLTIEITPDEFERYKKYKQALEKIRDRLIVVTEEEPQSTINLVLDLKPIIEEVLK